MREHYGLPASEATFLPLGHDSSAWVYRVDTTDARSFFLKVRLSVTNEASLLVPRFLHDRGVERVVAPLSSVGGQLWVEAGGFALILYPFVAGMTGMDHRMSAQQWRDYGATLRKIHDVTVTPELARLMRRESFAPEWGAMVRRLDAHIAAEIFAEPAPRALASFWQAHREEIQTILERAEGLGRQLVQNPPPLRLCHADIHTGNVIVGVGGQIWIVDWDEAILAPVERDLMFAVGGISEQLVSPAEEAHFLAGYGGVTIDPVALAYYRYTWAVGDIGSYGEQVFFRPDFGPVTAQAGVDSFIGLFAPGEIVALALGSKIEAT
ncbi:MAG TPA: aminoglycoside phosphotransferase family protein [Thermomicrobiales bacterium]